MGKPTERRQAGITGFKSMPKILLRAYHMETMVDRIVVVLMENI